MHISSAQIPLCLKVINHVYTATFPGNFEYDYFEGYILHPCSCKILPYYFLFKLYLLYSHKCFLYVFKFLFKGYTSKVGSEDICFSCIILHLITLSASSGLPLSLIFWSDYISIVCCPQYFHKPQIIFFIYPSKDQSSHLWWWVIYSRCPLKPDLSCTEFLIYNLLFFLNWLT